MTYVLEELMIYSTQGKKKGNNTQSCVGGGPFYQNLRTHPEVLLSRMSSGVQEKIREAIMFRGSEDAGGG